MENKSRNRITFDDKSAYIVCWKKVKHGDDFAWVKDMIVADAIFLTSHLDLCVVFSYGSAPLYEVLVLGNWEDIWDNSEKCVSTFFGDDYKITVIKEC